MFLYAYSTCPGFVRSRDCCSRRSSNWKLSGYQLKKGATRCCTFCGLTCLGGPPGWAASFITEDACGLLLSISSQDVTPTARLETCRTVWLQVRFATMAESYEKAFDMYVGVSDPQKLNKFWTAQLQGSPYLGGRPELLQQIQQGARPLPMALHGDGASVTGLGKTWQKGIDAYSIHWPLSSGAGHRSGRIQGAWTRASATFMCRGLVSTAVVGLSCSLLSPGPWIAFTGL